MNKASLVMVGIAIVIAGAVTAWALAPADTADTRSAAMVKELPVVPESDPITCEFDCEDEYGFLYYCDDPSLAECCAYGETACADHGGLEDGVCRKGRLGLNCVPVEP